VLLAVLDGGIDQLRVLLLLGRGKDQGRIGGGILGVVLGNGRKVTRVADDNLCTLSATFSGGLSFVHAGSAGDMSGSSGGVVCSGALTVPVALSWSRELGMVNVVCCGVFNCGCRREELQVK
jgi:hypothetical protein